MKIVADQSIPVVKSLFDTMGDVHLVDSRNISQVELVDADILIVRTVTQVNRALLENTAIRFVVSATSGIDHIDTEYLDQQSIGFVHVAGCNARSVAEYVLSSLFVLKDQNGFNLEDKTVGIIGYGHVGSMVSQFLQVLGINCLINDPPLQQKTGEPGYCGLDEIAGADIITLHVPLSSAGVYPTAKLISESFLSTLKSDVTLINTSRGGVIDEDALSKFLEINPDSSIVLDVWENEPVINTSLLDKIDIGTAHIAGYSSDARVIATWSVFCQTCKFFDQSVNDEMMPVLSERDSITLAGDGSDIDSIQMAVLSSYDVRSDDATMRDILDINEGERSAFFSELRINYPIRREFSAMNVCIKKGSNSLTHMLSELGFIVTATG